MLRFSFMAKAAVSKNDDAPNTPAPSATRRFRGVCGRRPAASKDAGSKSDGEKEVDETAMSSVGGMDMLSSKSADTAVEVKIVGRLPNVSQPSRWHVVSARVTRRWQRPVSGASTRCASSKVARWRALLLVKVAVLASARGTSVVAKAILWTTM